MPLKHNPENKECAHNQSACIKYDGICTCVCTCPPIDEKAEKCLCMCHPTSGIELCNSCCPSATEKARFAELLHKAIDKATANRLKNFIRTLLENRDNYWKAQEMGKCEDCMKHCAEALTAERKRIEKKCHGIEAQPFDPIREKMVPLSKVLAIINSDNEHGK